MKSYLLTTQRSTTTSGTLGILVAKSTKGQMPITESAFTKNLCLAASAKGLTVFAFTPYAEAENGQISGYTFRNGTWVSQWFPFPDIIYDRCFASGAQRLEKRKTLAHLARKHHFRYLGRGTSGKWAVYQALKKFPSVAPFLPDTHRYEGLSSLNKWLDLWQGELFLKPQHGTHGKLALHLKKEVDEEGYEIFHLTGRDSSNAVFKRNFTSLMEVGSFIESHRKGRPFLLQPCLQLLTAKEEPFDIRVLVQKGEEGQWKITGMAARVGEADSLTSNLHGGGKACRAEQLLKHEFGSSAAQSIVTIIRRLSAHIPSYLEERFGRLAELGIDFGVDADARVWVLEVNSKPGRSAFRFIGDRSGAKKSVENPVLYACYLLKQPETIRTGR